MEADGINNASPFAAERTVLMDGHGRDLAVLLVQATFLIKGRDALVLAEEQRSIAMAGTWNGEPGKSSYRQEPQIAPFKPSTDVVLLGHAYPYRQGDTRVDVGLQVGPVSRIVRVHGDRHWVKSLGGEVISPARPFERVPLTYEVAFGGWDRRHPDAAKHRCERRNPMGMGFRHWELADGWKLPNLEDPAHPIRSSSDTPPPAGFGFIGPDWLPRVGHAGTYDDRWMEEKMPLLPDDFNPRFYNAASPGLVASSRLRGDETVVAVGASPRGRLAFRLPGLPPPQALMEDGRGNRIPIPAALDTVTVDTDAHEVLILWRGFVPLRGGLAGLGEIDIAFAREISCPLP